VPGGGGWGTRHESEATQVLEHLRQAAGDGAPELLRQVLALLQADAAPMLATMREAVSDGVSGAKLQEAAHSLKGAAANLGAVELSQLCARLEQFGRDGSPAGARPLLAQVEEQFQRLCQALETAAGSDGSS
jgi:two-component system, sensor histidine kinase and response regulator